MPQQQPHAQHQGSKTPDSQPGQYVVWEAEAPASPPAPIVDQGTGLGLSSTWPSDAIPPPLSAMPHTPAAGSSTFSQPPPPSLPPLLPPLPVQGPPLASHAARAKSDDSTFCCTQCRPELTFSSRGALQYHRRLKHEGSVVVQVPGGQTYRIERLDGTFTCPLCLHSYHDTATFRTHLMATSSCCLVHHWPLAAVPKSWTLISGPPSPSTSTSAPLTSSPSPVHRQQATVSPVPSADVARNSTQPATSPQSIAVALPPPFRAEASQAGVSSFLTSSRFGLSEQEMAVFSRVAAEHRPSVVMSSPSSSYTSTSPVVASSSPPAMTRGRSDTSISSISDLIATAHNPSRGTSSPSASPHAALLDLLSPILSLASTAERLVYEHRAEAQAHVDALARLLAPSPQLQEAAAAGNPSMGSAGPGSARGASPLEDVQMESGVSALDESAAADDAGL